MQHNWNVICILFLFSNHIFDIFSKHYRICISKSRWKENRNNCSACWPQCNSIGYSFVRTSFPKYRRKLITTRPRLSETKLKRDIKFGIHYLVGKLKFSYSLYDLLPLIVSYRKSVDRRSCGSIPWMQFHKLH